MAKGKEKSERSKEIFKRQTDYCEEDGGITDTSQFLAWTRAA